MLMVPARNNDLTNIDVGTPHHVSTTFRRSKCIVSKLWIAGKWLVTLWTSLPANSALSDERLSVSLSTMYN